MHISWYRFVLVIHFLCLVLSRAAPRSAARVSRRCLFASTACRRGLGLSRIFASALPIPTLTASLTPSISLDGRVTAASLLRTVIPFAFARRIYTLAASLIPSILSDGCVTTMSPLRTVAPFAFASRIPTLTAYRILLDGCVTAVVTTWDATDDIIVAILWLLDLWQIRAIIWLGPACSHLAQDIPTSWRR